MPPGFPPGGPAPPFPPAGALPPFPPPPFVPGASATPPIPPLPPRGLPPPQFVPAQQQPTPTSTPQPPVAHTPGGPFVPSAGGPLPSVGGPTSSESQGPTTEVRPADPRQGSSQLTHPPRQLTLPNPALAQTNPEFKKPTVLKWLDPNFSPVSCSFLPLLLLHLKNDLTYFVGGTTLNPSYVLQLHLHRQFRRVEG
jgi:hypothetical protein